MYVYMELLRGKPTSVISVKSDASYEDIMHAIHLDNIPDKTLRAVVTTCRAHPQAMFVVYRAYAKSVLLIFGEKPVCVELEGSRLQSIMGAHCRESRIYVFSYVP